MKLSFWDSAYFQGRNVKFPGVFGITSPNQGLQENLKVMEGLDLVEPNCPGQLSTTRLPYKVASGRMELSLQNLDLIWFNLILLGDFLRIVPW